MEGRTALAMDALHSATSSQLLDMRHQGFLLALQHDRLDTARALVEAGDVGVLLRRTGNVAAKLRSNAALKYLMRTWQHAVAGAEEHQVQWGPGDLLHMTKAWTYSGLSMLLSHTHSMDEQRYLSLALAALQQRKDVKTAEVFVQAARGIVGTPGAVELVKVLLHYACRADLLDVVQYLLSLQGVLQVDVNANNGAAFTQACLAEDARVMRWMLQLTGDQRVDVHANAGLLSVVGSAWTPRESQEERLQTLLALTGDRELDVNDPAHQFFYVVCRRSLHGVLDTLLALQGHRRVDVHPHSGIAVAEACSTGDARTLRTLLQLSGDREMDLNVEAVHDALVKACRYGQVAIVTLLLQRRPGRTPVNVRNSAGEDDAYEAAVQHGHFMSSTQMAAVFFCGDEGAFPQFSTQEKYFEESRAAVRYILKQYPVENTRRLQEHASRLFSRLQVFVLHAAARLDSVVHADEEQRLAHAAAAAPATITGGGAALAVQTDDTDSDEEWMHGTVL